MYRAVKRLLDIFICGIGILVTLPLQVIIAFILMIELRENPIFVQERAIAFGMQHFNLFKFRTIQSKLSGSIRFNYKSNGFLVKQIPFKLTPFAKFLRKTGLDELLQIYNVLFGHMSLVGPRPLMLDDLRIIKEQYFTQHTIRTNLNSKPGITGLWQVSGVRELGIENLLGLDLFYEENKSFKLDMSIFCSTIVLVFFSRIPDGVVSRVSAIEKIYSTSNFDYRIDHGKYLKQKKSMVKSYLLTMPNDWWCASDTYAVSDNAKHKKLEKEFLKKEIFTN